MTATIKATAAMEAKRVLAQAHRDVEAVFVDLADSEKLVEKLVEELRAALVVAGRALVQNQALLRLAVGDREKIVAANAAAINLCSDFVRWEA